MFDKNGKIIKKGSLVKYEGRICKVTYIFFRTIILDDNEKQIVLKVKSVKYPILNLEVLNGRKSKDIKSIIPIKKIEGRR